MIYALIDANHQWTGRMTTLREKPPSGAALAAGKAYYVPVNDVQTDVSTGSAPTTSEISYERTFAAGYVSSLVRRMTTRDLTTGELSSVDDEVIATALKRGTVMKAMIDYLHELENRLRALEGSGQMTKGSFTESIKMRLR